MNNKIILLQRQVAALEKSVQHWQKNLEAQSPREIDTCASSCACCVAFKHGDTDCENCPIKETTGFEDCADTPYFQVTRKLINSSFLEPVSPMLRQAVQDELHFLKEVLDNYRFRLKTALKEQVVQQ